MKSNERYISDNFIGIPIRSVMVLDDDTSPALLQSCYPQKDLK